MVFVCSECGQRFYKGNRMRDHITTKHSDNMISIWNTSVTDWCERNHFDPEQFIIRLNGGQTE